MMVVRVVAAVLLASLLLGCNSGLARQMVTAPNKRLSAGPSTKAQEPKNGRIFVEMDDKAVLAGCVLEPKNGPARGTILVLHGFLGDQGFVRGAAEVLADAGYRAVLLDLRGHGQSTGRHVTYGVRESRDMIKVLDYLQKAGLAEGGVGVYGTSLGAAVGLQWAAIDPRVKVVVSVSCFATLKDEAPHFARVILPLPGLFLSEKDMAQILARAGEIAHFDPDEASPLKAIKQVKAKVLLVHGDRDLIIPVDHSKRLHQAAPWTELIILSQGHWAASYDWGGDASKVGREFFDRHLPPAAARE